MTVQFNGVRTGLVSANNYYQSQSVDLSALQRAALLAVSQQLVGNNGAALARLLATMPAAPMPRPPAYSVTLPQAAFSLESFAAKVNEFAGQTGVGQEQAQGIRTVSDLVNQALVAQAQAAQISISVAVSSSTVHIGADPSGGVRKTTDEFGTGLGAGKGHTSNLANSPEVVLALNSLLKGKSSIKMEEVQKQLKEQFGIESELTKIDGRKALKFANGDYIVDANGNGALDSRDYKFKEAVSSIKEKYGLSDEQVKGFNSTSLQQLAGVPGQVAAAPAGSFLDYQQFAAFFLRAYQYAA
ncbi:MAG: hypothetical protein JXR83_03520 [Deltaproteobacteria bacterium]|nr:hypothetical protein [Deltaproteobacteria bacterium]